MITMKGQKCKIAVRIRKKEIKKGNNQEGQWMLNLGKHNHLQVSVLAESTEIKEKCRIGMEIPVPGGYTMQGRWFTAFCNQTLLSTAPVSHCLKGKLIYLLGDSTLRQWIYYLPKVVKSM